MRAKTASSRETGGASTLSRCASNSAAGKTLRKAPKPRCVPSQPNTFPRPRAPAPRGVLRRGVRTRQPTRAAIRSEEHTSELQSHSDLVCRLLLEKKKKKTNKL